MRRFRFVGDPSEHSYFKPLEKDGVYPDNYFVDSNGGILISDVNYKRHLWQEVFDEPNPEIEKLQAFKDYVHKRLDDAGIEKNPNGEHSKHGCRIGDRLDLVLKPLHKDTDLGYFAIEIMKSIIKIAPLQKPNPEATNELFCKDCISLAKELIKQLNEETK